jgi:hypothetical protein
MDVLSKDEMDARISEVRPIKGEHPSVPDSFWSIEQPWQKGSYISVEKAKRYAAELRALVAENEFRYLKREFDREVERNKDITAQLYKRCNVAEESSRTAWYETTHLKQRLRKLGKKA